MATTTPENFEKYTLTNEVLKIKNDIKDAFEEFLAEVYRQTQEVPPKVPVKTGHLRDESWVQEVVSMGDVVSVKWGYVTKDATHKEYAMPVDYRTFFFSVSQDKARKKFKKKLPLQLLKMIKSPTTPGRAG